MTLSITVVLEEREEREKCSGVESSNSPPEARENRITTPAKMYATLLQLL